MAEGKSKNRVPKTRKVATKKEVPLNKWKYIARWVGIPFLVYLAFFTLYAWPWMSHFNTHFFTDQGDGFQNVWNIWWVNKSVTQLHQLPWHTNYLHYPYGTTLIAQTLNPFNGFVAIPLLKVMSLAQAFNTMVIFSFVFGGMSAFWLCYFFSKKYIPALIGGFIFTFSSYHFAHAIGHMQLVSLEFIPLFILLWWKLLLKPRYRLAVGSALVLLLVLLCDYYYFLYCVVSGGLILLYLWRTKRLADIKLKTNYLPLMTFAGLATITTLPLPLALVLTNKHDPLIGSHPSKAFSTDVFSVFITGGFWHFARLTNWYWRFIKTFLSESSVYLGVSVITVSIIALWKRNKIGEHMVFWLTFGGLFGLVSMGPRLKVFGYSVNHIPLPYAIAEHLVPELRLSGVPVRMMVMVTLAAAVICSMVLAKLDLRKQKGRLLTGLFFVVLSLEMWPGNLPLNVATHPKYLDALKKLPVSGVLDNGAVSGSWQLYDQTIHEHPMALGYISRTPTSVDKKDNEFTVEVLREQYANLCKDFKIRYFTTPAYRPLKTDLPIIYNDHQTLIYDLKNSPNC